MPPSRRDHLIDAALSLFCRNGFHATGIDAILTEAGVAKMTLYNHFRSKDDLILAALRRRDANWRGDLERTVERLAETPRARLLAIFDALAEWLGGDDFHGCVFINASAEYGRPDDPIHLVAAEHKQLVQQYLRGLAKAAGASRPNELAEQLGLLIDGATVTAQVTLDAGAAREAKRAASILIDSALGEPSTMKASSRKGLTR